MFETILAAAQANECAYVAVPEASELAMQYYRSGNVLWIVQQFWALFVPLLILSAGWSAKMEHLGRRLGRKWYFSLAAYLILFSIVYDVFSWPLDFYSEYIREHVYGLSAQTFGRWFGNWGKAALVSLISFLAFAWIFYLLLKKSPKRWWFYSSLVSIALTFLMILVKPIWIDPLFNRFGPMKNKELEGQILSLASRAGIEGARVYEVDMSQDTKALNAYVTGFGATKRIVLWDTTIAKLTPDQILFVMGHEMGHYVLDHIWWYLLFMAIMSFLIFYLTYKISTYLLLRFRHRFGFEHLYQFASLPLLLFTMAALQILAAPVFNFFSRTLEHDADRFGLEITQDNQAAGEAFVALQQENLANPRPGKLFVFWRASHPPLGERIDFCNTYCPWEEGKPLKYGKYFSDSPPVSE
jgi:Zn-dependent protease with chaperone function